MLAAACEPEAKGRALGNDRLEAAGAADGGGAGGGVPSGPSPRAETATPTEDLAAEFKKEFVGSLTPEEAHTFLKLARLQVTQGNLGEIKQVEKPPEEKLQARRQVGSQGST